MADELLVNNTFQLTEELCFNSCSGDENHAKPLHVPIEVKGEWVFYYFIFF